VFVVSCDAAVGVTSATEPVFLKDFGNKKTSTLNKGKFCSQVTDIWPHMTTTAFGLV
jgi:hypothetical protein